MMKYFRYILLLCAICGMNGVKAQLRLMVDAPGTVDINEPYFQVRYQIASDEASGLNVPEFADFELLAGPNVSVSRSSSNINGRVTSSSSTTFTYTLAPRKKGSFTIAPATVNVKGHTYRSSSVVIRVDGKGTRQQTNSQSAAQRSGRQMEQLRRAGSKVSERDLYISPVLEKKEVYEQEAVLLTYKFYERPGVGLNSVGLSQKPDFKGIVSQELPVKNIEANVTNVNGMTYRTGNVQQYLLYPQQAGTLNIPGLAFDCVVLQRDATMDPLDAFFNGGGNIGVTLKRQVPSTSLHVKPLPTPKPAGFSGGVGHFNMTGKVLNTDVRTNEMTTYRLTISGNGNLKLLTMPEVSFPSDFDVYSPKSNDQTQVTATGVTGAMSFDYTFVPRNIGNYEIPEVRFVYFDPSQAAYKTIEVPAIKLEVKKGNKSSADVNRERMLRESDIRDIHEGRVVIHESSADYYWWGTWSYWLSYVVLAAMGLGGIRVARRLLKLNSDEIRTKRRKASKVAHKRLQQAEVLLNKGDKQAFYTELSKTMLTYVSDVFNVPVVDLTREQRLEKFKQNKIQEDLIDKYERLLEECEYARFAPTAVTDSPDTTFEQATQIIEEFERFLKESAHS